MQAEPLIETLKNGKKNYTVVVSFFSPSGFMNVKNSDILIKGSRSLELEKSLEIIKQISV